MELNRIYASVKEDLDRVEDSLKEVGRVSFEHLAELLNYSLERSGKRIRPALTFLCARLHRYDLGYLMPMAVSVELMHTATLVHDDAVDKSAVRRGRATVNKIWGEDRAVLLGDYLFARAGDFCADTGNLRVIKLFSQTLATISRGELKQAFDAFKLEQTYDNYLQRISSKTAALFSLATESGAVLSQASEDSVEALREYGNNLGIAFQIVDDILDFIGTEEELGKPVGSDLTQGTLTLPAMLLLKHYPGDNPVEKLFQNIDVVANARRAIEMIGNSPIVQECYNEAATYSEQACRNLDRLPPGDDRQALVELADYIIRRRV
ncbi:polyprenyl synthetase family protein [Chloroflexota bacterium]